MDENSNYLDFSAHICCTSKAYVAYFESLAFKQKSNAHFQDNLHWGRSRAIERWQTVPSNKPSNPALASKKSASSRFRKITFSISIIAIDRATVDSNAPAPVIFLWRALDGDAIFRSRVFRSPRN